MGILQHDCEFGSASECLSFLKECFADRVLPIHNSIRVDPDGSEHAEVHEGPQFLFRGEPNLYASTVPSFMRLQCDRALNDDDRDHLQALVETLWKWIASPESNFHLAEHHAEGLLQHLGMPTRYIDFSDDPEVAAIFAVGGRSMRDGSRARICVLDVVQSIAMGRGRVATFHDHPWCERAKRQKAYGYGPISFDDLKSSTAREEIGFRWFEFPITQGDMERFGNRLGLLLDEASDPVAGLLRVMINDYVFDSGPLRLPVAQWLTQKVPVSPLVGRVERFCEDELSHLPQDVEFLPPARHVSWDTAQEQAHSLRSWSEARPPREMALGFEHEAIAPERHLWVIRHLINRAWLKSRDHG